MMLQHQQTAVGKLRAQFEMEASLRNRTDQRNGIYLLRFRACQFQAREHGLSGHLSAAPARAPPNELRFLDGGHQFAVLQDGACSVTKDASDTEDDHGREGLPFSFFSILAQVSRKAS